MSSRPKPPSFLRKEARKKYEELLNLLMESGKYEAGDEIALSCLCASYQHWVEAEKAIKQNKDLCFTTETGYRQQIPEVSISNNAMKSMLAYIKEFALTPRERIKLKMALLNGEEDDTDDEIDSLIQK